MGTPRFVGAVESRSMKIVRAYFEGEGALAWPGECACCGGAVSAPVPGLDYSLCGSCHRHALHEKKAGNIAAAVGFIAPVIGWFAIAGLSLPRLGFVGVALYIAAVFLVGAVVYYPLQRFAPGRTSACIGMGFPVHRLPRAAGSGPERPGGQTHPTPGANPAATPPASTATDDLLRAMDEIGRRMTDAGYGLEFDSVRYARKMIELNGGKPADIKVV